jgi:tellurite resistance protein TerC
MNIFFEVFFGKPMWMWASFIGLILLLLLFDLGVLQKRSHEIGFKESVVLSLFYIGLALVFGGWVWWQLGSTAGKEYLTGFIIEKTLSLDNVFVISLIFSFFSVPSMYQHRVLFWGILGVLILRAVMIGIGAVMIAKMAWILYVFAAFLVFTGIKMLVIKDSNPNIEDNKVLKLMRKYLRITPTLHGEKFMVSIKDTVTQKKHLWFTPLFVTLVLVEFADLIFAVDSIPAIFSITQDPFIVYTSNIFAILGLRALYFALAAMVNQFAYLRPALAVVLIFIGSKIFVADLLGLEKIPASISLGVTLSLLMSGVLLSIFKRAR